MFQFWFRFRQLPLDIYHTQYNNIGWLWDDRSNTGTSSQWKRKNDCYNWYVISKNEIRNHFMSYSFWISITNLKPVFFGISLFWRILREKYTYINLNYPKLSTIHLILIFFIKEIFFNVRSSQSIFHLHCVSRLYRLYSNTSSGFWKLSTSVERRLKFNLWRATEKWVEISKKFWFFANISNIQDSILLLFCYFIYVIGRLMLL